MRESTCAKGGTLLVLTQAIMYTLIIGTQSATLVSSVVCEFAMSDCAHFGQKLAHLGQ